MIPLRLADAASAAPSILLIGAHSDDIEIGCGGTLIELLERHPAARIHWAVMSADAQRADETRAAARRICGESCALTMHVADFQESHFPAQLSGIKGCLERLKRETAPDVVFVHYRDDLHQDHRVLGEAAWNTFRDHLILEFEIPKYDGGLGSPGVFMPVSEAAAARKVATLLECFASQSQKRWFTAETFYALMRIRGIECNSPSGYAEAFYARKLLISG